MSEIDRLVEDFLAQKRIAVVGVSDKRETGCNLAYRNLKKAGYDVAAVNPRLKEFEGDPCYPNLRSIPARPEAVFILTKPAVTDEVVDECLDLGIRRVWMHCLMGTKPGLARKITSVSRHAVAKCREAGITVIPGSCPNQFLNPDFGHSMMRVVWRTLGFMKIDPGDRARAAS